MLRCGHVVLRHTVDANTAGVIDNASGMSGPNHHAG